MIDLFLIRFQHILKLIHQICPYRGYRIADKGKKDLPSLCKKPRYAFPNIVDVPGQPVPPIGQDVLDLPIPGRDNINPPVPPLPENPSPLICMLGKPIPELIPEFLG